MKGENNNKNKQKNTNKVVQPQIGTFGSLLQSALDLQKENLKTNKKTVTEINLPKQEPKKSTLVLKPRSIYPEVKDRNWKKNNSNESLIIDVPNLSSVITQDSHNIRGEEFYFSQISQEFTEESELVIGLDFGTSCTKAIIRDNSLQLAYAVPFNLSEGIHQMYLVATKLFVRHNGECSLQNGDELIDDAKIQLMENPDAIVFIDSGTGDKITALEISISYIALILREIRHWFFKSHSDKYKNKELLWELNIGLPSRSYDDKVLHQTFKLVALAGWNVSTQTGKISLDTVRQVLKESKLNLTLMAQQKDVLIEDGQIHPESVNAIPEVISEIVGYAKSPLRREGLHLLIDIGAGTVDITTFILYTKSGNDLFTLLTTEVKRYGAIMLHKHRLSKIIDFLQQKLSNLYLVDGMIPLPKPTEYLPSKHELNFNAIDDDFIQKLVSIINTVVTITKNKRDPRSNHWKEGLPVFLCGGGSQLEVYKNAIQACSTTLTKTLHIADFNLKNIPKPEGLEAPNLLPKDYHRIAVAYGLSFTFDDVGRVIPPSEVENITLHPTANDYTKNYIGAELM